MAKKIIETKSNDPIEFYTKDSATGLVKRVASFSPDGSGVTIGSAGVAGASGSEVNNIKLHRAANGLQFLPNTDTTPDGVTSSGPVVSLVNLSVSGVANIGVSTKTANYVATKNDSVILCDATSGGFTVTLPDATTCLGTSITIKKIDSTTNRITVQSVGGQYIDGDNGTEYLPAQWEALNIVSNGTKWFQTLSVKNTAFVSTDASTTLAALSPVYVSQTGDGRTAGKAYLSDATNTNRINILGFTYNSIGPSSTGLIITSGVLTGFSGLTSGAAYYADPTIIGAITATKPTAPGKWVIPVGFAISSTAIKINISTPYQINTSLVVGTAAQVSSGLAQYSDLQSAVSNVSAGGKIVVLSGSNSSSAVTIDKDNVYIQGDGNAAVVANDINVISNNCVIKSLRCTGNLSVFGGNRFITTAANATVGAVYNNYSTTYTLTAAASIASGAVYTNTVYPFTTLTANAGLGSVYANTLANFTVSSASATVGAVYSTTQYTFTNTAANATSGAVYSNTSYLFSIPSNSITSGAVYTRNSVSFTNSASGFYPGTISATAGAVYTNNPYIFTIASANTNAGDVYTSGAFTFNLSATASVSATAVYTLNSYNYTVTSTITGTSVLTCTGNGFPPASGTLTKVSGTGPATLAYSSTTNNVLVFAVTTTVFPGTSITACGTGAPPASGTLTLQYGTGSSTLTYSSFTASPATSYVVTSTASGTTTVTTSGTSSSPIANPIAFLVKSSGTGDNVISYSSFTASSAGSFLAVQTISAATSINMSGTASPTSVGYLNKSSGVGPNNILYSAVTPGTTQSYSVSATISAGTSLVASGTGTPSYTTGYLVKVSGTGDSTITYSAVAAGAAKSCVVTATAAAATTLQTSLATAWSPAFGYLVKSSGTGDSVITYSAVSVTSTLNYKVTAAAASATTVSLSSGQATSPTSVGYLALSTGSGDSTITYTAVGASTVTYSSVLNTIASQTSLLTSSSAIPVSAGYLLISSGSGSSPVQYSAYSTTTQPFTVYSTISGGTTLTCTGLGATAFGYLAKNSGTGDSLITFSSAAFFGYYNSIKELWAPNTFTLTDSGVDNLYEVIKEL